MREPFDELRAIRVASHLAPNHPRRSPWRRDLHSGQRPVFSRAHKRFLLKWGRRTGKSYTLTAWLVDGWQDFPTEVSVFVAQTQGHARRILWATLLRFDKKYALGIKFDESKLTATFPNGYQIWLTGCSSVREAEKLRGSRYRRVAIDEAGTFDAELLEYLIDDVVDPALMDLDGELALSGTPGVIPMGYFFERCTGVGPKGEAVPTWPMFEATCLDNPFVNGRKYLAQKLREKGWTEENPTFRREYLGQWVIDLASIVYPFVGNRNGYRSDDLPTDRGRNRTVIAVDLGWHDDTAIVVSTSHAGHPDVWYRSAWKSPGLLPGRIAAEIERRRQPLLAAGDSVEIVVDTAGGGKIVAEELKETFALPIKNAEKRDKKVGIELLRGGLLDGNVHLDPYTCASLISEWSALPYSDDRSDHHDQYPNHCADAALYGYRQHRLAYRPENEPPRPGSDEWIRQERARERLAAQKRARKRAA